MNQGSFCYEAKPVAAVSAPSVCEVNAAPFPQVRTLAWAGLVKAQCVERVSCRVPEPQRTLVAAVNGEWAVALRASAEASGEMGVYQGWLKAEELESMAMYFGGCVRAAQTDDAAKELEETLRTVQKRYDEDVSSKALEALKGNHRKELKRPDPVELVPQDVLPVCAEEDASAASLVWTLLCCPVPQNRTVKKHRQRAQWRERLMFRVRAETVPVVALADEATAVLVYCQPHHVRTRLTVMRLNLSAKAAKGDCTEMQLPDHLNGRVHVDANAQHVAVAAGEWAGTSEHAVCLPGRMITCVRLVGEHLLLGTSLGEVYSVHQQSVTAVFQMPHVEPVWDARWLPGCQTMLMQGIMSVTVASAERGILEVQTLRPLAMAADEHVMTLFTRDGYVQTRALHMTGVVQRFNPLQRKEQAMRPVAAYRGAWIKDDKLVVMEVDGRVRVFYLED